MSRKSSFLLAVLTGALLCAAHGYFAGLAWLAPVPLLVGLRRTNFKSAAVMGFMCGVLEAAILFGLSHAGMVTFLGVALMYGLSRLLFCCSFVAIRDGDFMGLLAPSLWVLLEWVQCQIPHTLPNLLGDTLHGGSLFGILRLGGTYLLSFLVVWAAALIAGCVHQGGWRTDINRALVYTWLCVFCVCQLVGTAFTPQERGRIRVSLVQGGIPVWLYERGQHVAAWKTMSERIYTRLSLEAKASELTIWPETAVDETYVEGRQYAARLRTLALERGSLLLGTRREENGVLRNSALLLSKDEVQSVDKRRLALPAESRFETGKNPTVMQFASEELGVIFCLESVVPQYASQLVEQSGADMLVVLADGTRFGNTPVGRMHAQRSTIRAVESGVSLMHVGQHGFTHVVDAQGRSTDYLEPFHGKVLTHDVALYSGVTPFRKARHGVPYALGVMVFAALCLKLRRVHHRRA